MVGPLMEQPADEDLLRLDASELEVRWEGLNEEALLREIADYRAALGAASEKLFNLGAATTGPASLQWSAQSVPAQPIAPAALQTWW